MRRTRRASAAWTKLPPRASRYCAGSRRPRRARPEFAPLSPAKVLDRTVKLVYPPSRSNSVTGAQPSRLPRLSVSRGRARSSHLFCTTAPWIQMMAPPRDLEILECLAGEDQHAAWSAFLDDYAGLIF